MLQSTQNAVEVILQLQQLQSRQEPKHKKCSKTRLKEAEEEREKKMQGPVLSNHMIYVIL